MRYSDRVKILTTVVTKGPLGDVKTQVPSDWLPCRITGITQTTSVNILGKYDSKAVVIHFKTNVGKIDYVLIDSVKRLSTPIKNAKGNTVVVVGGA